VRLPGRQRKHTRKPPWWPNRAHPATTERDRTSARKPALPLCVDSPTRLLKKQRYETRDTKSVWIRWGDVMRTTNRLTLIGHVTSIKPFQKATKVTVTTNRSWTSNGEHQERASYVPVTLLDAHEAKWAAENVGVGDLVHVEARVEEGSYGQDQDKTYTINIVSEAFNLLKRKGEVRSENP